MSNEIKFEIKIIEGDFRNSLTAVFDKQIFDQWGDDPVSKYDFEIDAGSVTELYNKLYDATQTNDIIGSNAIFMLNNEVFAKVVDGFHLEFNENISNENIDKYRNEETIDFVTKDKITQVYGADIEIKGSSLYRNDDIRAYVRDDSSDYIHDSKGNKDFKDDGEVKKALDFYLKEDRDSYGIKQLDKTHVTLNGEKYKTLIFGKEIELEKKKVQKRNRPKR